MVNLDLISDHSPAQEIKSSQKRKRGGDQMKDMYHSMKKLKTEDEVTKRILLVVHYMNEQPNPREIIVDGNTGTIKFGRML
jgi:hypothetical protein